jgi:hypothetical protein
MYIEFGGLTFMSPYLKGSRQYHPGQEVYKTGQIYCLWPEEVAVEVRKEQGCHGDLVHSYQLILNLNKT